ncbi:MAG: hypothetical protein FD174_1417 [Geobacteraceae bacterium]|nr:MAG: hypothetical protein FD174_1417 [Geobacteraceae bacterium]
MNQPTVHSQTRATWVASIAATLALIVSLFSLYESHEARISAIRDNVTMQITRYTGDYPLVTRNGNEHLTLGAVEVLWEVLLSNTGGSTVSLTGYEILQVAKEGGEILYTGMDRGIITAESLAPIHLPIALEAGKSIKLLLKIGISPGNSAFQILSSTIAKEQRTITLREAEKYLALKHLDIYDNTVIPYYINGDVSGWRVESRGKEQVFLVRFRTARGTEISKVTHWYDLRKLQ